MARGHCARSVGHGKFSLATNDFDRHAGTMRLTAADKVILYRELAKLIGADFHFDRALTLLIGQNPPAARREFLLGLQGGVARGDGIARSLEAMKASAVSGLERALVAAGEKSGTLAQAFEHLARYFAALDAGIRQARSAMIYPLILVHVAIVLPEIPAALMSEGRTNPAGSIITKLAIFWAGALLIGWLWRMLSRAATSNATLDRFLSLLPLVGRARRHWALARFAQVFHAGLLAALRMSDVTRIAGEASQSGTVSGGAAAAAEKIDTGQPLAASLRNTGAFPALFVDAVATAEEAGTLDREMERWATLETDLATESMERVANWLPKIGYGVIVVYVAWRIISMALGIYSPMLKLLDEM